MNYSLCRDRHFINCEGKTRMVQERWGAGLYFTDGIAISSFICLYEENLARWDVFRAWHLEEKSKIERKEKKKGRKERSPGQKYNKEHKASIFHLVVIQVLSVPDSLCCSTTEVTHITSLLFKQRKSPIKISWVYFSTLHSGSLIDWKGSVLCCEAIHSFHVHPACPAFVRKRVKSQASVV